MPSLEWAEEAEEQAEEEVELEFSLPQFELISTDKRYPAMVAGFGAGKTAALIQRALRLKFAYPGLNVGYYLPTYDLVKTIAFPRFEEVLGEMGMIEGGPNAHYSINRSDKWITFHGGVGKIIFRTMDTPGRIIGYEVADSLVDELDTLKLEDARNVWRKIIARNRQKKPDGSSNTIAVGTTPEGFRFVYETWKRNPPSEEYHIIKASTYSNARNLPDDYISDLLASYPASHIQAYIDGEFVNLTSGSVYPEFDRLKNHTDDTCQAGEAVHIGMDFNVGAMAAVVFVQRGQDPVAVNELVGILDTPNMIKAIKRVYPNSQVYVYPDATGDKRNTNNAASESDIALLRQAGFTVFVNKANPRVRDRVLSMNVMIHANDKRRLKINTVLCPSFTESLEKQPYDKNGEPDKTTGLDHVVDAGGYFVCYRFPVRKPSAQKVKIGGH